ncbi:keratin-associated protein 13-2-like [Sagmatias obliquidens]|uniref:keratin-associated protein 13-2-like n=1 Tax=Sagmatias obliquidens TaxID=3371155 RepID=UPI000F440198|nr:keratin-associated protein 13-2-like [Lagenorhynchus obliquidens]
MSYNCCSGNFSHSLGDHLSYPGSSCGSSYPSNLVYSTDCCSPSTCQPSCVVFSPRLMSCYSLRTSMLCRHFQITYYGSLDCGSIRGCSLGYGSRSSYSLDYGSRSSSSLGCGSSVFRPLCYGVHGFLSLIYGSRFYYPTYLASRSFQSSGYRATYRSAFCRSTF